MDSRRRYAAGIAVVLEQLSRPLPVVLIWIGMGESGDEGDRFARPRLTAEGPHPVDAEASLHQHRAGRDLLGSAAILSRGTARALEDGTEPPRETPAFIRAVLRETRERHLQQVVEACLVRCPDRRRSTISSAYGPRRRRSSNTGDTSSLEPYRRAEPRGRRPTDPAHRSPPSIASLHPGRLSTHLASVAARARSPSVQPVSGRRATFFTSFSRGSG